MKTDKTSLENESQTSCLGAVMRSVFSRKQTYNSEDVVVLMTQLSSYLTTKELNDLYQTNFMEWCRKRDWFIEHTMKKYKGIKADAVKSRRL